MAEFPIKSGESVWVRVSGAASGAGQAVYPDAACSLVVGKLDGSPAIGSSTHWLPPVETAEANPLSAGSGGTYYYKLATLTVDGGGDMKVESFCAGSNVQHFRELPKFGATGSGEYAKLFTQYNPVSGQYDYKGVSPVSAVETGSGASAMIEISLAGEGGTYLTTPTDDEMSTGEVTDLTVHGQANEVAPFMPLIRVITADGGVKSYKAQVTHGRIIDHITGGDGIGGAGCMDIAEYRLGCARGGTWVNGDQYNRYEPYGPKGALPNGASETDTDPTKRQIPVILTKEDDMIKFSVHQQKIIDVVNLNFNIQDPTEVRQLADDATLLSERPRVHVADNGVIAGHQTYTVSGNACDGQFLIHIVQGGTTTTRQLDWRDGLMISGFQEALTLTIPKAAGTPTSASPPVAASSAGAC